MELRERIKKIQYSAIHHDEDCMDSIEVFQPHETCECGAVGRWFETHWLADTLLKTIDALEKYAYQGNAGLNHVIALETLTEIERPQALPDESGSGT